MIKLSSKHSLPCHFPGAARKGKREDVVATAIAATTRGWQAATVSGQGDGTSAEDDDVGKASVVRG